MIIHSGQDINLSNANETKCKPKLVNIEVQENVYAYVIGFEDEGATDLRFWRGDSNTLWNCSVVLNYEDYANVLNCIKINSWDNIGVISVTEYDMDTEVDSDGDEIELNFSPLLVDTDYNGIWDCDERIFQNLEVNIGNQERNEVSSVSVEFECTGYINSTTSIEDLYGKDIYVSDTVGLVGVPIDINSTSAFDSAVIKFYMDSSCTLEILDNLLILWYDEENDRFVEQETTCYRKLASKNYVKAQKRDDQTGIVLFASTASVVCGLTNSRADSEKMILLVSDGESIINSTTLNAAISNDIKINTVYIGGQNNNELLRSIAEQTGGQYFKAVTADELIDIYSEIIVDQRIDSTDSDGDGIPDIFEI